MHLSCTNVQETLPASLAILHRAMSLRSSSTSYSIFANTWDAFHCRRRSCIKAVIVVRGVCETVYNGMSNSPSLDLEGKCELSAGTGD